VKGFDVGGGPTSVIVHGWSDLTFNTTTAINEPKRHVVAMVYDGTNATADVDGVALGSASFAQPLNTSNERGVWVGSYANGYSPVAGYLDEISIFPAALTSAQIAAQYSAAIANEGVNADVRFTHSSIGSRFASSSRLGVRKDRRRSRSRRRPGRRDGRNAYRGGSGWTGSGWAGSLLHL
jgi:hypothetical protein